MTRVKALTMLLKIVKECEKHDGEENGGCLSCPFGSGGMCMASRGTDIPITWAVNDKIQEWTGGQQDGTAEYV